VIFALSGVIILAGIVALGVQGLNLGIDFKGGTQITFNTHKGYTQPQVQKVVAQGRSLWTSDTLATNGLACVQCHPNAANTHPETYPKFQKQLGKVAQLWEMVNWCLRNPLQGQPLGAEDPRMTAILSYVAFERRGVTLAPGTH